MLLNSAEHDCKFIHSGRHTHNSLTLRGREADLEKFRCKLLTRQKNETDSEHQSVYLESTKINK